MDEAFSVSVIFLTTRLAAAIDSALTRASMAPTDTSTNPGRRMISAPTNPTAMAMMRRMRMTSPRNSAAPTVTKIGPVKDSAVISASGISVTAVNPLSMPMKLIDAREKKSFGRFILMLAGPCRISTGAMIRTARMLRKKTISITGTKADDRRMQIPIVVKKNRARINIVDA